MADLDYTGFGPTSAGRAPSAAELRRASTNRYHSTRAIEAMRFIDPTAIRASEKLIGMGMGKDRSPEAVRRTMYSTAQGQAVMDTAMAARSAGLLGYGDPRAYSANITQMMAGGGMRQSIMAGGKDSQAGRMVGFNQRVSGNGMIAERAAIGMQRSLLDNLYGKGQDTDPRKLNGYDMTEASQIAARVVGRGGLGNMMGLVKNADFGQRMASAEQSEVDPEILAGLKSLTDGQKEKIANAEKSGDSSQLTKAIDEVAATMKDPKAAAAFKNIAKSTDAMVFNEKNAKQLSDTVKEVTKGMAALNDIYGDLSSDDAHAMLEQINGGRITNKQQARGAARTVNDMRNAAEYAGMDPKQLFGMFAQQSENLKAQLDDRLGLDERSQTRSNEMVSKLASKNARSAAMSSKDLAEGYKSLGLEGEGYSADEIANDKAKMQVEMAEKFKGFIYSQGEMGGLNKGQQERMRELSAKFKNEKGDTDSSRRRQANLDQEMRNVLGPDFDKRILGGQGAADMTSGQVGADTHLSQVLQRGTLIRDASLMAKLKDAGVDDEEKAAQVNDVVLNKLGGVAGLAEYAAIDQLKTPEEREANRKAYLSENQLTEEEQAALNSTFLDSNGRLKEDATKNYGQVLGNVDWSGGQDSVRARNVEAKNRLANLEKNDMRVKMSDKDGTINARSILTAMARGDINDPMARADTAAATLDAMKSSGVSMMVDDTEEYTDDEGKKQTRTVKRDLTDMYESGLSLDKGFDDETLKKIDKVAGGDVNLVDRINKANGTKMTREEFMEKSKTDRKLQDQAYTELDKAGADMGFVTHGGRDNFSIMNDKAMDLGAGHADRFKKAAPLQSLAPFMSDKRMEHETNKALRGEKLDLGDLFTADTYEGRSLFGGANDETSTKSGKFNGAKLENSGKFKALADFTKNANSSQLKDAAGLLGDKGLAAFDSQIKAMEAGLADGKSVMVDDKGQEHALNQQTVNEFKAAVAALRQKAEEQAGTMKVGTLTVTKLDVTGDFNSAKK